MKYGDLTISKLRELSILEVANRLGFQLTGTGSEGRRTLCPYHDDKHPSLHFSRRKNIFKCFVCGTKGDLFKLVMDARNCTFPEACEWLANEFSIVVTTTNKTTPSVAGKKKSCFSPLSSSFVTKSLGTRSVFCQSLVSEGYMTSDQMLYATERYRLGVTKEGGVIFWEIDQQGQCHNGKIMHYLPDCHRDKSRHPTWVAAELKKAGTLPPDFENPHCLFGLHLLSDNLTQNPQISHESSKMVCVVESEKTAVICSVILPECIWLSCGGLQMLKPELLTPLANHKVTVFPDTDGEGRAFKDWLNITRKTTGLYPFKYPIRVSPLLELKASPDQKRRKIDLVDFLFEV